MLRRAVLAIFLIGSGCREKSATPPPPVKAEPEAGSPAPLTSLLKEPARVAVSSVEDSSDADPNFLLDGKTTTTWRSAPDSLNAWIAFRVPDEDRVTAIKIAFPEGVPGIVIERNGQVLTRLTVDPQRRDVQALPVQAAGGDFRIRISPPGPMTVPKAFVVSELEVLGVAGKSRDKGPVPKLAPTVRIGSLGGPEWRWRSDAASLMRPGPWASLDVYCKQFLAAAKDAPEPSCTHEPGPEGHEYVRVRDQEHETRWLAVKTSHGWWPQAYAIENGPIHTGFMHPEIGVVSTETARPAGAEPFLVMVLSSREWSPVYREPEKPRLVASTRRWLVACRFPEGYPACDEERVLAEWTGDVGMGFDGGALPEGPRATFTVEPDGGIALTRSAAAAAGSKP